MKIKNFLLMGAISLGLGFTACSSDDDLSQDDQQKGNTYVSVSLSMAANNSATPKALPDDYNKVGEWAGKDKINDVTIYLVDGTAVSSQTFVVGTDYVASTVGNTTELKPQSSAAMRTTAGMKKVYVLLNATAAVKAHLNKTPVAAFEEAYNNVALFCANSGTDATVGTSAEKIAVKNGVTDETILMTNVAPFNLNVQASVTQLETLAATSPKNRAAIQVERAVARVMITTALNSYVIRNADATPLGTISDIRWVLAQGETSLFVQRKSDWATPNYAWYPTSDAAYWATDAVGPNAKYDYSGLFKAYDPSTLFGGAGVPPLTAYTGAVGDITPELNDYLRGEFLLPNTHEYGLKELSKYKKGNTAYVLVRAKFSPEAAAYADGGSYTADADFFVGANGKFYTSAANAVTTATGGVVGQTVARYIGGKVLYYAWVNPDAIPDWYNSPAIRNHVYHIHITGFKNLGTNWNPLFPEDPDSATPLNPDPKPNVPGVTEPENPIKPEDPLTTPETWMSVDVTVAPWILHTYGVNLGI